MSVEGGCLQQPVQNVLKDEAAGLLEKCLEKHPDRSCVGDVFVPLLFFLTFDPNFLKNVSIPDLWRGVFFTERSPTRPVAFKFKET